MPIEIISRTETPLWVPLHVHSEYSAYDGAIRIKDYLNYATKNNLTAAAVTDHFTMSSFPEFDQKFSKAGIKPIYGNELYAGTLFGDPSMAVPGKKKYHLNSFAVNSKGLVNLQRLAASGFKTNSGSAKGPYYITRAGLEEYHDGIIFSSACVSGELSVLLGAGEESKAAEWLAQVQSIVGKENFYIEILDINNKEQDAMNKKLLDFARKHNVKTILTTDSHYMPGDESWYNYLLAAQKRKQETASDDLNPQQRIFGVTDVMDLSLRSPEQIWEKWRNVCPEAVEETVRLAERCEGYSVKGSKYLMPHKDFGENISFPDEVQKGLEVRLEEMGITGEAKKAYADRLEHELEVVTNMGFIDYFRFVSRLVSKCRNAGIYVGPGRGSAAGSVLTWSLGITKLDPIRFGLLFERFLNPERVTMPDIDIDFEDERRGDVIKMLKQDYGEENVVAITNYSRCKWKVAIRDVMRVKGYEPWESDGLVKLLEGKIDTGFDADADGDAGAETGDKNVTAADLIATIKAKAKGVSNLHIDMQDAEDVLRIAGNFNNLIRNYGKHASGIVICPGPAQDYMPLGRVNDVVVTQYDMKGVDYRKLVKVDILGLSTLSMIREMETSVNKISPENKAPTIDQFMRFINRYGNADKETLDGEENPLKDICPALTSKSIEAAYMIFRNAQTTGVFQFASSGMRKLLRKIKPNNMEDLSAAVALYRPGPLQSGIAEHFVQECIAEQQARNGWSKKWKNPEKEKSESPIEKLPQKARQAIREIAKDAKGEMIYQEHIMAAARKIAGYSLGEADILRKAMGKKDKSLMYEERAKFVAKAKDKGWTEEESSSVFDAIEYFAGYGFNKSHSFCYAALAFITAWYAANRRAVFWAALINDTAKKSSKDSAGHLTLSPIIREAQEAFNVYPPVMPDGEDGMSIESLNDIRIAKAKYIGSEEEVEWDRPQDFNIFLGLSSIKGFTGSIVSLQKLAALGLNETDTIETLFKKAVINQDVPVSGLSQAAQYLRNGFFDTILLNTIREETDTPLLPVYVRLAIIEMADTQNIDADLKKKMLAATETLIRGTVKDGTFPFKIVSSRCVWGSFLYDAAERIKKKLAYKREREAWKEKDVDAWIETYLSPVVEALINRAVKIKNKMIENPHYRISRFLDIYRLEKNTYGESFTIPDWAVCAEMTVYGAAFYADCANNIRGKAIKRASERATHIDSYTAAKEPDIIDCLLDKHIGVWMIGQFGRAYWRGEADGGYMTIDGRYGNKTPIVYVSVKEKLPLITLENMKHVSALGGMMALRVWYDNEKYRFRLCEPNESEDKFIMPSEFKAGFDALPDSIAILPATTVNNYEYPLLLPYRGGNKLFSPELKIADEDNKKILNKAIKIIRNSLKEQRGIDATLISAEQ